MFRKSCLAFLLAAAGSLWAQAPAAAPAFEVATIKPSPPLDRAKIAAGQLHVGLKADAGHVDIGFFSLADLIRTAYKIKRYQLTAPDWISGQRWDIQAKIPEGATQEQIPEMLQALLAERFKVAVHRASEERSVYALVAGKNGLKMKPAEPEAAPAAAPGGVTIAGSGDNQVRMTANPGGRGATLTGARFGQVKFSMGEGGAMHMEFSRMKMPDLAEMLSSFVDRPVVDMTGLPGTYQVVLELSPEDIKQVARAAGMGAMMMGPAPNAARNPADEASTPGGSIFTAVQALGLKLEARKAPVEMIVVDHAEKTPVEN